ncbi:MFS transporter [Streptomyces venezuelae]|uniref:MFS transporter n=1 Tax=Streptomyces venezuelae TaxID=54571 RepID=A0A5P2CKW8_STRVZ|nr:MFS transporter [Streptomyces venezuelae]QES43435.1 MFS transporter [Streptomyces venezuelae]
MPLPRPSSYPLLRNRPFRLLLTGRTLSLVGDAVIPAALALAVLRATGSSSALALVLGCAMGPRLLLLPLGGVVADRFDPRTVALVTDLARCGTQLFVGVELLGGSPGLWHIAVAEAVGGAASAFAMPTLPSLITGTVAPQDRHGANALFGVVRSGTVLGGPALAGLLIATAGPGWAFVLDAVSFAVSACLLSAVRLPYAHSGAAAPSRPSKSLRDDLVEGWQEVRSRDWYWTSLVAHAAWNGAAAVLMTLGPALAVQELGGEGVWIWFLQVGAVGLLLGSLLAGKARPRRPVLVANLGLATYALPLALLAAGAPAPAVIAAYGLAQAGLGFLSPVWETSVQAAIPAPVLARVTSYDWLLSMAAMPLGYVLAPLAASVWGAGPPLWVAAAVVGAACAGTAAVPGVRRFTLPAPAPTPSSRSPRDDTPPTPPPSRRADADRGRVRPPTRRVS